MNRITEMLRMQRELDEYIEETNNVRIEPSKLTLAILDELGELNHELKANWCWWKKTQKPVDEDRVLAELVDIWHFALSYNNHFQPLESRTYWNVYGEDREKTLKELYDNSYEDIEVVDRRNNIVFWAFLNAKSSFLGFASHDLIDWVLDLTVGLGYSVEDVYNAYLEKNKENYERQKRGY